MKKKLISILLVVAMRMGSLTCIAADGTSVGLDNFVKVNEYPAGKFADVPAGAWYEANVKTAYELGLVRGISDTEFGANDNLTIAEALTLACRIHSIYNTGSAEFVQGSPWYQVYVDYAVENGLVKVGEFEDYNAVATRAQYAYIFSKVLPAEALAAVNDVADGWIPDVDVNAEYADGVYMLYRAGVLTGNDATGVFKPDSYIIRAEVATIVTRMADESLRRVFLPIETPDVGSDGGSGSGTGSGSGLDGGASPEPSVEPSDENIYHPNGVTEGETIENINDAMSKDEGLSLGASDEGLTQPNETKIVDGVEYIVEFSKYTQVKTIDQYNPIYNIEEQDCGWHTDEIVGIMYSLYREDDTFYHGYRRLVYIEFKMHAGDTVVFYTNDYDDRWGCEVWSQKLDDYCGPYFNSMTDTDGSFKNEYLILTATNGATDLTLSTPVQRYSETSKDAPVGVYLEFDICADCEDDVVIPYVEEELSPTDIEIAPGIVLKNHGEGVYNDPIHPNGVTEGATHEELGAMFATTAGAQLGESDEGLLPAGTIDAKRSTKFISTVEWQKYIQVNDEIVGIATSWYMEPTPDMLLAYPEGWYKRELRIDFTMYVGDTVEFDYADYGITNEQWLDSTYNTVYDMNIDGSKITISANRAMVCQAENTLAIGGYTGPRNSIFVAFDIFDEYPEDLTANFTVDTLYDRVMYFESFWPEVYGNFWAMEKGEPFGGKSAIYYEGASVGETLNYIVVYPEEADNVNPADLTPEGYVKHDKLLDYYVVHMDRFSSGIYIPYKDNEPIQRNNGIQTNTFVFENDVVSRVLTTKVTSKVTGNIAYFDFAIVNVADLAETE